MKVTRWSPDTCDCIFEYEWDDTQATITHSFKKAIHLCNHHKALVADKAYDVVLSENTRKNIVFGEAQRVKPDITIDDFTWSFEGAGKNRKLKVGFFGKLMAGEKSNLQAQCNSKFGAGKVEII